MEESRKRAKCWWSNSVWYADYSRLWRLVKYYGLSGLRYLLPWHFYLDFIEIPITTKCNMLCKDCSNLMPFYKKAYDIDADIIIRSIQKISECVDVCGQIKILGGEPFLHPDLKKILAEIPGEKFKKITIPTNATVIPQDSELYEILRKKKVIIMLGNYPAAKEIQCELIAKLKQEKVAYEVSKSLLWINYGEPIDHKSDKGELSRQFARCNLRSKSLLNGILYYCPRHAHGYDLGIVPRKSGEYVDVLHNSKAENRRDIRKMMWRHKPVEACRYCLRGTENAVGISRGR